jgi:superfamily II DNA or RNA helicase
MGYYDKLLHYINNVVKINNGKVYNKQKQYSFLTDKIIIQIQKNPDNLNFIEKELDELVKTKSYDDSIKKIKKRYNTKNAKEKRIMMLSIMEQNYKDQNYVDSYDDENYVDSSDDEKFINYGPFEWKPNQSNALNETMNQLYKNSAGVNIPKTGIHCQATGAGKTFIGLNIIKRVCDVNNYNKEITIIWFTERKCILMDNFYKKEKIVNYQNNENDQKEKIYYVKNKENYNKWAQWDIIDISKFKVYQFVENKDKKWYDKINKPTNKPKLIIINRTFLANQEKYKYINKNKPCLIIHDECHSAVNETSYKFLTYAREEWNSSIIGFSATPIRINNKNDYNQKDYEKLIEIFGIDNKINIISNYHISRAIEDKAILSPKFKWYLLEDTSDKSNDFKYMDINGNDTEIKRKNFKMAMKELDKCYPDLIFKKTIGWAKTIDQADDWKKLFDIHKIKKGKNNKWKYKNLHKIKSYVDHSKNEDEDYEQFEKSEGNCILFCVGKHREGSDIKYLDSCIFLDCVKNRSSKEFIQCIGRVLRKCGNKEFGLVIDGFVRDTKTLHEKVIIDKIIGYYLIFQNMELVFEEKHEKIQKYNKIKDDIKFDNENPIIRIRISKNNYIEVECNEFDWSKIGNIFSDILKKGLKFDKMDEFDELKDEIEEYQFKDKNEYFDFINKSKKNKSLNNSLDWPTNPEVEYSLFWNGWYDFLGTDTSKFIKTKDRWIKYCNKYGVKNPNDYNKLCKKKKKLPRMPEEFYHGFTNIESEMVGNNSFMFI